DESVFKTAYNQLKERYDNLKGGFGSAPKFPTPHNLSFLLRYWKSYNENFALEMVEKTLIEMRKGGMYDQIGFGFHRYSTDANWLVPHFEKMLYDQALIAIPYIEVFQITKNEFYKNTAEEILNYVLRDMTSANGGFYSAEDADSEGVEGKFYLWTIEEIKNVLENDSELFNKIFNIKERGNWIDPVHGSEDGTNISHLTKTLKEISKEINLNEKELKNKIEKIRKKLFDFREKRIHPYKDDKILTDWNALMITALAKASQTFNNKTYSDAAEKSAKFILEKLMRKDGSLLHRYREGEAGLAAHIDDYAFFIAALLDLYETTFKVFYLEKALELNEYFLKHFWDENEGAFYFTSDESEELIARQKEIYDGAIPSGNSVAVLNLLRLSRITGNIELEEFASKIGTTFSKAISQSPSAFAQFLMGLNFALNESNEIVIVGEKNNEETKKILAVTRENFMPNKIVILKSKEEEKELGKISSFIKDQKMIDENTTVYICKNFVCEMPVTNAEVLKKKLNLS
ncbi:MAG: thioredoxin domain-containing protein, partial [Ignavibacteriaceae bacterium]